MLLIGHLTQLDEVAVVLAVLGESSNYHQVGLGGLPAMLFLSMLRGRSSFWFRGGRCCVTCRSCRKCASTCTRSACSWRYGLTPTALVAIGLRRLSSALCLAVRCAQKLEEEQLQKNGGGAILVGFPCHSAGAPC